MFLSEIKEVIDNYEGKKTHFFIRNNLNDVHLKIDSVEEKDKWVKTINELRKYYNKQTTDLIDNRKNTSDILEAKIVNMIMKEQEREVWAKAKKEKDFSKQLKIKKISNYLDIISSKSLEKRIQLAMFKINSGKALLKESEKIEEGAKVEVTESNFYDGETGKENSKQDTDFTNIIQVGNKKILPKNFLFWEDHFCIMISSKSIDPNDPDETMLTEQELPPCMDTDTLYLFEYKSEKDESDFVRKITGAQIIVIEPFHNNTFKQGNYYFIIETKEDTIFFETQYASEVAEWLLGLRRIKKTKEEQIRSKLKELVRNIDPLITMFKEKKGDEIMEKAKRECCEFTKDTPVKGLVAQLKKSREFLFHVRHY